MFRSTVIAFALPLLVLASCAQNSDSKKEDGAPAVAAPNAISTQDQLAGYWRLDGATAKKDAKLGKFAVLRFAPKQGTLNQMHYCSKDRNGLTSYSVAGKTLTFAILDKKTLKPSVYKAEVTLLAKDRLELNKKLVYRRFTPKAELSAIDKNATLCK